VKRFAYLWIEVVETLLRMLPFPCKTGLIEIGAPGRDAPVLLTGNFRLTVERVKRSLRGIDAYLLVANSRGVNVWCAATGGLFTNHDVVSVLKTSGVEGRVDHRRVTLPQLAATGIEGPVVRRKTGWTVVWGPVEAAHLPEFLRCGGEIPPAMRKVGFPWPRRLEMAVAWAFPISLLAVLLLALFWPAAIAPVVAMVWGMSLLLFLGFPLFEPRGGDGRQSVGLVFFDFGPRGAPVILWVCFVAGLVAWEALSGALSWNPLLAWGSCSLVVLAVLGIDLMGSTPQYKSGLHDDRRLRIVLDEAACKGAAFCEQVCPTRVFEIDRERRLALLPRSSACVQCGACVVQCPFDALHFEEPDGSAIAPETIRRFKLNLVGKRVVHTGEDR